MSVTRVDEPAARPDSDTTIEARQTTMGQVKRGYWLRLLFLVVVAAFVAMAVLGVFGAHTRQLQANEGGVSSQLTYAQTTRRGLTTAWELQLTSAKTLDQQITVVLDRRWLDRMSVQRVVPEPSSDATDASAETLTFDAPGTRTFTISLDANADPSAKPGRVPGHATVRVGSRTVARFSYRTMVWP
ncbi:MAG: hypothetical protein JO367_19800 [Actinobacteria bacterium]|nr:hypothetical protein [Actinomycetota bacterium]